MWLLVASGDIIVDTIMTRRLEQREPIILTLQLTLLSALQGVEEPSESIARAACYPALASGSVVTIGGSLDSAIHMFGRL